MKQKLFSIIILTLCLHSFLSGCVNKTYSSPAPLVPTTAATPTRTAIGTPNPTVSPTPTFSITKEANATVLEIDGISIAFPNEYYDLLLFNPEKNFYRMDGALLEVFHKKTYEESIKRGVTTGWLFSIMRYTPAQYEQYLCKGDHSGQSFFAKDDTYYYGYFRPTDVQITDKNDLKTFDEIKQTGGEFVRKDMVTRNNLTPYSDSEFLSKTFTYESEHIYLNYYPYYAYEGTKKIVWKIVLSQPVKLGATGIWCVERLSEGPIYFPNANGMSSADYYAKLQKNCEAGLRPDLLDPVQVALDYVKLVWGHTAATKDSFIKSDGLTNGSIAK